MPTSDAPVPSPTSRYRSILTEGSVIIFSILIAFAVDAMWENHRERGELASLIGLLPED